ncbi:MAG: prepilin-type N-terminal cleavage/methylation domain-containing protein [Proteobacteria bacterium]|nr:prepilin-type N-terminal cleavage/methylation domain-containing protein [Pseudomonadota bacterium]
MKVLNSKSRGVTLIELSIVLAILGVLIVATISGKSLIDISRATATMQQLRDRSLAFQIFSSTYDCIPGDCIDAQSKIAGVIVDGNGNGDGTINLASATHRNEVALVEHHLIQSKLFTRTIASINTAIGAPVALENPLEPILPKAKVTNGYISSVSSGNNFYNIVGAFSQTNSTVSDLINYNSLAYTVLQIVDSKVDDGIATTGSITCHAVTAPTTDGLYVLPATATDYTANCTLAARMDF